MRSQVSNEGLSSVDRALGFTLAAFSMFVVGYTATRAFLSQPQGTSVSVESTDFVIPHQATLWSDFGN
ncbi:MAG: hypothetical protein AAGE96_26020 [Cyanobacteria bacterium P01_G01_bin.19]